ncbi:MAG: CRISPR-associated protein Cas4 [Candidatus Methanofastidiosia archaeon]
MAKLIWVSELFSMAVCPQKHRLRYVLKLKVPPTEQMVLGAISHSTREMLFRRERDVLKKVKKKFEVSEIESEYEKLRDEICAYAIAQNAKDLDELQMDEGEILNFIEQDMRLEFALRAVRVMRVLQTLKLESSDLADFLSPPWKYVEYKIISKKLKLAGVIDRIERHANKYYPIELKTGKPPVEDVRFPHKIQIGCYALVMEDHFKIPVNFGFIEYTQLAEKRPILTNDELKDKVLELRDAILQGKEFKVSKSKRCESCEFKEVCEVYGAK